jgi:hypothetical protein
MSPFLLENQDNRRHDIIPDGTGVAKKIYTHFKR